MVPPQRDKLDGQRRDMERELKHLHGRMLEVGQDEELARQRLEAKTGLQRGILLVTAVVKKRRLQRLYRGFAALRWFGLDGPVGGGQSRGAVSHAAVAVLVPFRPRASLTGAEPPNAWSAWWQGAAPLEALDYSDPAVIAELVRMHEARRDYITPQRWEQMTVAGVSVAAKVRAKPRTG